jgi:AAA family ATP:ADP antiporter
VQLSPLERFLRLFTDVRPGEGGTALLMFANVFLILCAYYFVKPLREGWIMVSEISGLEQMEVKAYTYLGQILLLILAVAWYSGLVNRWPRAKLITWATLFCMSNMVLFWFLQPDFFFQHLPVSGIVFYLWVGIFGVFVVAQFWAFAADVYSDEAGRRLIPMVAIGATAGAAFGSQITEFLVKGGFADLLAALGLEALAGLARRILVTESLLLVALLPLGASIVLTRIVDRRQGSPGPPKKSAEAPASVFGGLSLVLSTRFLLAVTIITLVLNWVNTNGEFLLTRVLEGALRSQAEAAGLTEAQAVREFMQTEATAFYGNFFKLVNVVALVLQAFVASRLLKYGGFGAILLLLPVVALTSYATMALVPILLMVKLMKVAENATDYSINNTARHVLWLPLPSDVKFKGKPTIDSLFVRLGDGMATLTVLIGVQIGLATAGFFAFNVALVLVWIFFAVIVVREHRRLTEASAPHAG